MNREPGDRVATYLGVQGFAAVVVERARRPQGGSVKVVRVKRRDGQHEWPECGRRPAGG